MRVLQKGSGQKGWATEATCTGYGNGGGGCRAILLVEERDLYVTCRSDYTGMDKEFFATFKCPECGIETDLQNPPSGLICRLQTKKKS